MHSFYTLARNDRTHWFFYILTFTLPWVVMFIGVFLFDEFLDLLNNRNTSPKRKVS